MQRAKGQVRQAGCGHACSGEVRLIFGLCGLDNFASWELGLRFRVWFDLYSTHEMIFTHESIFTHGSILMQLNLVDRSHTRLSDLIWL